MDGADTELYSNRGASHLMIGNEDAASRISMLDWC
jgi:hypothetical protein